MKWPHCSGNLLLMEGRNSYLLIGKIERPFSLFIETSDGELIQSVTAGDLVVVSSPEGGPLIPAIMLLELVRTYHTPLVVLPRDHPGTKRLKMVVAVAPSILTSCEIVRGTHPEQHLLCSSEEFNGISLRGDEDGVFIEGEPPGSVPRYFPLPSGACEQHFS